MKQIGIILTVILFAACNHSEPFKSKTDTVDVIYRSPQGLQGARGTYTTKIGYKIDTASRKVTDGIDTAWSLLIPNPRDTMKDPKGKPIYDSATHSYRFNNQWYKLSDQENKTVKIQIIKI
jgi:hypothetical protein